MSNKRIVFMLLSTFVLATTAFGATVTKVDDAALAPLRTRSLQRKIRLDKIPLFDGSRTVIDLEEFQVWAPDGKIIVHGDNGAVLRKLDPPPMRFFRGLVNGDPESFAYFSMDPSGRNIQGLIVTRDKKFALASSRRPTPGSRGGARRDDDAFDTFLTEADDNDADEAAAVRPWQCEVDKRNYLPTGGTSLHATGLGGLPVRENGISGTQSYAMKVDIETDFELYTNAGSNVTTLTNYVTNLSGAVSTIYNRDLKTNVTQGNVDIYTTSSDPWAATDPNSGLLELGDFIHSHPSTASSVVFLSGKNIGGGVAWEAVACGTERLCSNNCGNPAFNGHYAGPYAWCGGIGNFGSMGLGSIPNVSTPPYGMPSGTQNYWPLEEYAHELGHNLAGHHTHCVAITDAERIAAGFTDGSPADSTSDFVDHCYAHEGIAGCFAATMDYNAGSQSVFKGTIMSYCHNVFVSGVPQSRFTFGQPVEASHHELDDYMLNASLPLVQGTNIVTAVGAFTISAITAPATVPANSMGNAASITAIPSTGATYAWTIVNGTITSASTTSSITFTAGASGTVTLRATAYGTNRCGVTDTKSVVIGAAVNPPTNVTATAATSTSVGITWTAATGAVTYHVYRSANGTTYAQVGNPAGTSFTDSTGLTASTAYLYKVRTFDGSSESADSNIDLATTVIPTNAVSAGVVVSALDFTEIRTAVNAVQTLAGTANTAYTDPVLDGTVTIKKVHIDEPLTRLNAARSALGLSTISLSGGVITQNVTPIRASDVNDLRAGVR
jgi:hypothetical protein